MISHLSYEGGVFLVHLSRISLKTTKAFTHASLVFCRNNVTFAKLPAVPLPAGFAPSEGLSVTMQLVGVDGEPRKQIRTAILCKCPSSPATIESQASPRHHGGSGQRMGDRRTTFLPRSLPSSHSAEKRSSITT